MDLSRCPTLLLLLFALFCSCYDEGREDIPPTDKRTANFTVKYNDGSGIHPNYNAKVYIYCGIYSIDIAGFRYLPDGVLEYRRQKVVPDITLSADGRKDVSLLLSNTEKVAVVIESPFYEGKIRITGYSPRDISVKATSIFGGQYGGSGQPPECLSSFYDI